MKIALAIRLRGFRPDQTLQALADDPEFSPLAKYEVPSLELDAQDPRVDRILSLTRDTPGLSLMPRMSFTAAEIGGVRYLQPLCRRTVSLRGGEADEYNARHTARLEARDFLRVDDRQLCIKLLDEIELRRVSVKPNVIAGVGEWGDEYVVGRAAAQAFKHARLTGCEFRPIRHPKTGGVDPDHFHLYSESIMPPAEMDVTTLPPNLGPDPLTRLESFRQLGCLTYRLKGNETLCDFNRTAENWCGHTLPTWVVTARVRECCLRHKLKGWEFQPVLEAGTVLHQQYLALWEDLRRRVAVNPRNRF